jgi:subtilisin family serine protease
MSIAADAPEENLLAAHHGGMGDDNQLPIIIELPVFESFASEGWKAYCRRVGQYAAPLREKLKREFGIDTSLIYSANSLKAYATPDQIERLESDGDIAAFELNPPLDILQMDDTSQDLKLDTYRGRHPDLDGNGVKVAVLDSGIDTKHPFLSVAGSENTTDESASTPGSHATHCAGIIASTDDFYKGIAPKVTLFSIKVVLRNGRGHPTDLVEGIDLALDLGVDVLSISVGFNHLPEWSNSGHGWSCADGRCRICLAVDNATAINGAVVVAAAGNYHTHAEGLRSQGHGNSFDTELVCPGQARNAITVAAVSKTTFMLTNFSSQGPTADGRQKPDISAPGVNVKSTKPAPRNGIGVPVPNPSRSNLFIRESGTSVATPMVAAAAALLIQEKRLSDQQVNPLSIKQEIIRDGIAILGWPSIAVGAGRLEMDDL